MSSFNDTSGYSGNSSTLDDAQTGDGSRLEDQTSPSPSRISGSEIDRRTASFTDEEATFYEDEYTSGYDTRTYDTRTYDTRTHDDSSFPQSPRSDELSSTFASFYLESDAARKVKSTISFLRKPLLFFSFALPGTGGIGAMCRVVHAVTVAAAQRRATERPAALNNLRALPDGYTDMPAWMKQARLALPSFVETAVKKVLRSSGVPSLADLQRERWRGAMEGLKRAGEEIISQATYVTSGPMVPLVVFLPLFSVAVITVARRVVAQQHALHQEEEEVEELGLYEDEGMEHIPPQGSLDASRIPDESEIMPDKVPVKDMSNNIEDYYDNDKTGATGNSHSVRPIMGALHKAHSSVQAPSESHTNPHTMSTSRDLSPISSVHEEAFKHVLPHHADAAASVALSMDEALPRGISSAPYALKGDAVAALVGSPSAKEVDVLLVAAARYNCRRLILPDSLPESALASMAPSLSIERVADVMEYIMDVEEPRGLTTIGVFLRPITDDAVELSLFTHPSAAVYVFVPATGSDENLVAHLVDRRIYVSSSLEEPIPANACFYDRSVKERSGVVVGNGNVAHQ
ncbi:hypothetical protein DQ04_02481070 [Trypanosoma grayi]|uniref:hypothetical protein n=1 Tax=Trypanosoma grayi TaxID=71804 RepID=UPI0004F46B2A|nr:hypothetical protein DQ04_02481070 [Trypanosoma grayi]KEG11572.1 hypothetical protein DQ04_02481070 [Trypanosoma grayi]